jgi:hypothetical protein
MAIEIPIAAAPPRAAIATAVAIPDASFEQRWAAWQAKGAAHERAVRRRMSIAAPILGVVAIVIYLLLGR